MSILSRMRRTVAVADQPVKLKTFLKRFPQHSSCLALLSTVVVSDRNCHPSVGRLQTHRSPQQCRWFTGFDEVSRIQVLLSEFQSLLWRSSVLQRPTQQT